MKKILPGRGFYRTVTLFICLVIFLLSCSIPQHATQPINGYDAVRVFSISDTAATTLPDSVFRYINLEQLYLMPAEMAVYPPITAYTEKPMRFTGLPPSICQLKRLKLIDLTYNKLEDIPDLSCLDSLLVLNLAFNSGISIARRRDIGTIKKMKNLQVLFVAGTDYLKEDIVNLQQECKGLKVMTRYDDYFKYLDSLEKNLFRNRPQNDWHDGTK